VVVEGEKTRRVVDIRVITVGDSGTGDSCGGGSYYVV